MPRMVRPYEGAPWKAAVRPVLLAGLLAPAAALAQAGPTSTDFANLQEDVRGLSQRVNDLSLRVEQLEHENGRLRAQASAGDRDTVTLEQLNAAVADLNRALHAEIATAKDDTLARVAAQMEKLARQVNAALDAGGRSAPAAGRAPEAAPSAGPAASFPQTGISYTVQKGETLAQIAKKNGARLQDIVNANHIADPSRIQAGQVLFVPVAK